VSVAGSAGPADAATFHVAGTGDSILAIAYSGIAAPDRWIDVEQGRQPYIAGMQGRASTSTIWPWVLRNSQPGGWVIIQDNGALTSDADWRALMRRIVTELPNDRCLLFVLPAFHPAWSRAANLDASRRANIMVGEAAAQPCHDFVRWNQAVAADSTLVYDGQHPSAKGARWLAATINSIVG
jgi:hypothetical protein